MKEKEIELNGEKMIVETWTEQTCTAPMFGIPKTNIHGVYEYQSCYEVNRNYPWLGRGSVNVRGITRKLTPFEAKQIAAMCHPTYVVMD